MDDFFEFQVPTGVVAGQRALATLGEEVAGLEIGRALTHAVEAYLSNHRDPSLMPWRYRRG
ncbi:MAG TPA: hypothetical protein GX513_08700, partial [Firmicutes bacterium]|nr:hypothetical protein [Bacillota bacterium]